MHLEKVEGTNKMAWMPDDYYDVDYEIQAEVELDLILDFLKDGETEDQNRWILNGIEVIRFDDTFEIYTGDEEYYCMTSRYEELKDLFDKASARLESKTHNGSTQQ